jgi:hypothetical protein
MPRPPARGAGPGYARSVRQEQARERRREAGGRLLTAWAVAIVPNALDAIGVAPDGWAWTSLRVILSVVFTVALLVFLVTVARELRARQAG